jgi:hypothetical protein
VYVDAAIGVVCVAGKAIQFKGIFASQYQGMFQDIFRSKNQALAIFLGD